VPQQLAWGLGGSGFQWYDTGQAHIVSNTTFRRCGVDTSGRGAGCGDGNAGCSSRSSVWAFLTHSDEHVPEYMQATKGIRYEDCGTRFRFNNYNVDSGRGVTNGMSSTVSERLQSWFDADGTASGLGVRAIMGSASSESSEWWRLDEACSQPSGNPLWLCKALTSPDYGTRQVGSFHAYWMGPNGEHVEPGDGTCDNGRANVPCTPVGYIKHWGGMYRAAHGYALPLTLNGESSGPLGGFGWHMRFLEGLTPATLDLMRVQVPADTKLLLSIAYPANASNPTVTAYAPSWCFPWASSSRRCQESFTRVATRSSRCAPPRATPTTGRPTC